MKIQNYLRITMLAVFLPVAGRAESSATETHAKKIETVLDKLEKRLIDNESSPFTDSESDSFKTEPHVKMRENVKQKYSPAKPSKITANTPSAKNIRELQTKLNEYDNRIEILEADIRKIQASVYEGSTIDNQVSIMVKAIDSGNFIIRTITARLDGNTLYNQQDPAGLWMPSRSIPVYFGPMQPGEHRVELTATIAPLSADGLGVYNWKQKSLQQSFSFNVAAGRQRKSVVLEIDNVKGGDNRPLAKMTENDIYETK